MKKTKRGSQQRLREGKSGPSARSRRKRSASTLFELGAGASQRTLLAFLRKTHSLGARRRSSSAIAYYDTFDWRVHTRDRRVSVHERDALKQLSIGRVGSNDVLSMTIDKVPCFASDLPRGPQRRQLEALIKVRRLAPVAEVEVRSDHYAVLDDERKTVVRIVFERTQVRDPGHVGRDVELPPTLRVVSMRGYRRAYSKLLARLDERSGLEPMSADLEDRALACLGRDPRPARSVLDVQLDAGAPIGAAFVTIHRALFEAMQRNEPGIRAVLDTEYLHEFRVAARRARVFHRIFRDLIRDTEFDEIVPRIKWLRSVTGPTRDLDVQLLDLAEEREELGDELDALIPLESLLREHRHAAWQRLVDALDSADYEVLRECESKLFELPASSAARRMSQNGPALGPWASRRIARAARRLLKDGRRIDDTAPDAQLHRLRLEGKKLRYLLEFFSSLYPGKQLRALIRELKKLQDNLGAFNDACVRADLLHEFASELATRGPESAETVVAVGRLVERAENRKAAEREAFALHFEGFDVPDNRARLRSLFGSGKKDSARSEKGDRRKGADRAATGPPDEGSRS